MAQYEMNLRDSWLIVRRRRWTIVGCMLLSTVFSFWLVKQKVPVYQATAAVKFEQSTSVSGLMVEVLSYSSADNIETQASLIRSYPILEEVARRMGRLPPTVAGEALRESKSYTATLENIGGKIRTARVPSTSILEITATSTNAREARDLANAVAEVYRDYNRRNRNVRITEARKFIEAQLREVEGRVKRAEEEVWAFRDANRVISPGAESTVLLSLFTQVRGDIERTRQQRVELEQVAARLTRTDRASLAERVFVDTQSAAMAKLSATQTDLLLERNNLALEVTERHPRLQAVDDRLREVRAEMRREVSAQVALLRNREDILSRQMAELLQKNREVPAIELNLARLQRDAKVNDDLLTLLKTKHQEALIKESEGVEEVALIRPASEPAAPVSGDTLNTLVIGALLGLVLGLVFAFVQETLDTSIGTIEDVESYLEVPVLGIVPHIDPRETMQRLIERRPALAQMEPDALQSHSLLITHFDPKSPVAEAYRTLRTNIQFQRMERAGKILVVTSPTLQEGKTTTIVNLALTMAQNGQRTLLVGANMRRPSIYRFFGIEREPGLSNILVGSTPWRDCVRGVADILMGRFEMEDVMASPGLDNLHIIEAGPIPANPSELLSTSAMTDFLAAVREEYDIVLIDTPPILPVTDSALVAGQVDGVLLVYQAGKVGRLVLKRAKAHLEAAHAKVWGVVLNDLQTEISGYTYTHYYTHYYGEESGGESSGGTVQRVWDAVRSMVGRRAEAPTPSSAASAPTDLGDAEAVVAGDAGSLASRYRERLSAHKNLVIVLALAVVSVGSLGVAAWGFGWLDASPTARVSPPATAPAPPRSVPTPLSGAPAAPAPTVVDTPPPPRPVGVVTTPPPFAGASTPSPAPGSSPSSLTAPLTTGPAPAAANPPAPGGGIPPGPRPTGPFSVTPSTTPPMLKPPPPASPALGMTPFGSKPPAPTSVGPSGTPLAPKPPAPTSVGPGTTPVAPRLPAPTSAALSTIPVGPRPPAPTSVGPSTTPLAPRLPAPTSVGPSTIAVGPKPAGPAAAAPAVKDAAAKAPAGSERALSSRFAVEFGPFAAAAHAEQLERTLTQAGYQTVRFRQQTGAAAYAVLIERLPSARAARALVATLQEQGLGEATVLGIARISVRVGEPLPLRGAVVLAERVRAAGHQVRVAAQGEAVTWVLRYGNFVSREEAEAAGRELARLNLPPAEVVQVR